VSEDILEDCRQLYPLMRRFWLSLNPKLTEALLSAHINMPQYLGMVVLNELGETTMGELGKRLGVSLGATTNVVDRLVQGGYAVRTRAPEDRRIVRVSLTPQGERMLASRDQGFIDHAVGVLGQLPSQERKAFLDTYGRIVAISEAQSSTRSKAETEKSG